MQIKQVLQKASATLSNGGIEEATLEAGILLRHVLNLGQTELHIRLDETLSSEHIRRVDGLINRRLNHEPIAYITGNKEFFGLAFYVNKNTLIPRPETEVLVEKAIEIGSKNPSLKIVDVGTGCGAIAIALAKHLPEAQIYAVDISHKALEVADLNRQRHGVSQRVQLIQSDLLKSIETPVDLIVANLPYITDSEMTQRSPEILRFEPQQALCGGPDGLKHIDRLLRQSETRIGKNGAILLEIGQDQAKAVIELTENYFSQTIIDVLPDLSGADRVIYIKIRTPKGRNLKQQ